VKQTQPQTTTSDFTTLGAASVRADFRKIERREWWLWMTAGSITLLLTIALASFFLPSLSFHEDVHSLADMPQAIRGLVALVFLFDLYVIYQQLQIFRMRRQLIERETLFRLISENAADMIAVVDMEGHRLYNSLSYQRLLGYSVEELRASSSFEQVHPDDRERVKQAAAEARRTGIGKTLEYRMRNKNGTWLEIESTASVIRNARGEPERLVIVNRDITERKKAEEALFRSEVSFRSMIEDAPYGIYRATMGGRFLQVNPSLQRMLGYDSAEELLKADLAAEIFRRSGEFQRMSEILSGTLEAKDFEVEWKRRDGKPIIVRCSGHCVKDEHNLPAYLEVFAEDVSEKRVLERQLRMAQKMEAIGRLSGGVAHDFNNLLGVIIGYSGVLKKSLDPKQPGFDFATEIEKAGQRAAALTRQLLAFSRQQILTPAVLNLNTLITDMGKMIPRLLGENIEMSLSLDAALGNVKADQSQIEQIVMNLAVNSRDAMPMGGKLKIETSNVELDEAYTHDHPGSRVGQFVMLQITDTGTGMDSETLAHIFEPFFTTKERGKGTGMGLATVYGIVKQSNGYIWVESAPGKGASFQIYLPRHLQEAESALPKPELMPKAKQAGTVLLVEDADALRKLAQTFLQSSGLHVLTAASGEEALAVAAQHGAPLDLLLTDVVMPGMNGRVLAEQLSRRQPGIKVLYMSGYTDSFIAGHGVLQAGTNLLHKPFTEEVLLAKVHEVMDGGKQTLPGAGSKQQPSQTEVQLSR
jgi:two-component system, cell cycle sensor histidine kinase and response regulator CckA